MKVTIKELESYLSELYANKVDEQSLFMKLVEEIGETAEILNKRNGRKKTDSEDLDIQLGNELADVIHYVVAIAALNNLNLNDIILSKDKKASLKYNRDINLEQFISSKG
ncbi:MAG: nucleotide pyrophosphohydrolase [Lachnospiraceae bacterium]|nr:nucleotide pyrophosphohydrolase [Lachnospiraceae bacterium]